MNLPSWHNSSTHFLLDRKDSHLSNLGMNFTSSAITALEVPKYLFVLMKCIRNQNSMEGMLSHNITLLCFEYLCLNAANFLFSLSFHVETSVSNTTIARPSSSRTCLISFSNVYMLSLPKYLGLIFTFRPKSDCMWEKYHLSVIPAPMMTALSWFFLIIAVFLAITVTRECLVKHRIRHSCKIFGTT